MVMYIHTYTSTTFSCSLVLQNSKCLYKNLNGVFKSLLKLLNYNTEETPRSWEIGLWVHSHFYRDIKLKAL